MIQTHYVNDRPGNRRDRHIWHYCYLGEHEKCAARGSLIKDENVSGRTRVTRYQGSGFEIAYCECPCHTKRGSS